MPSDAGLVQLSSRSSVAVWCVVKRDEADLLPHTLGLLAQHQLAKHVVVVHTGPERPASYGDLQRQSSKFSEHHQDFGEGLDRSPIEGGFDQVAARNFALAIAESLGDRWLLQFDADDYYDPVLLDRIAKLPPQIRAVRCACFHLVDARTYWHNKQKLHHVDGLLLNNPHVRIWRNDRRRRFSACEQTAAVALNETRHCGVDLCDLDDSEIATIADPIHLHLHHMLDKSDRSVARPRRRLPRSVALPRSIRDFLRRRSQDAKTTPARANVLLSPLSLIPSGPETIVHFPLRGIALRATNSAVPILTKLRDGSELAAADRRSPVVDGLRRAGLIGHARDRDRLPIMRALRSFEPTEATLIFTETCNLGCSYCYASSTPAKRGTMPWRVAKAAVDFVVANASRQGDRCCSMRYIGGGEPTIEWALLERTNDYAHRACEEHQVKCDARLITNGTLLSRDRVGYIAENIDFVTLSFEILPELQLQRPFAGGKSSHDRLLQTVELLSEYGVKFHFRTTVTEQSVSRMVDMVWYAHLNTNATSIRFEPMAALGRGAGGKLAEELFVEQFLAARRLGATLGIDVKCKMIALLDEVAARFCDAEFSVGIDGAVSACHRYSRPDHENFESFKFGQFDGSKFTFDLEQLNRIRGINVHSYRECDTCFARWNCAGGCLSARMVDGAPSATGPLCHVTRELLKASIVESLNASEGEANG